MSLMSGSGWRASGFRSVAADIYVCHRLASLDLLRAAPSLGTAAGPRWSEKSGRWLFIVDNNDGRGGWWSAWPQKQGAYSYALAGSYDHDPQALAASRLLTVSLAGGSSCRP